ncbi:MAG: hypothetical protein ACE5HD_02315 [Acidobacteriota bacterium]
MKRSPTARNRLRNSRIVRQPDRIQTRMLILALAGGLVVLLPLLANIWGHLEAIRLGYRIEQVRRVRLGLQERNRLLRTEVASLSNPGRIEALARELGLAPRKPANTIVVTMEETSHAGGERAASGGRVVVARARRGQTEAP